MKKHSTAVLPTQPSTSTLIQGGILMVQKVCCLCLLQCNSYKFLQNKKDDGTEVYDVTVKYFDPMILIEGQNCSSISSRVICCGCWSHIYDFHEFQQRVLKSRSSLQEANDTKVVAHFIKSLAEVQLEIKDLLSGDDMTDRVHFPSDQDDEIPLISLFQETPMNQPAATIKSATVHLDDNGMKSSNANSYRAEDETVIASGPNLFSTDGFNTEILSPELATNDLSATTLKIENGSEDNYKKFSTTIKIQELSSEEPRPVELCESAKTRSRGRITRRWLNEEQSVHSPSDSRGKLFGAVRKKNKTKLRLKRKNSATGKLKDKCRENDVFISKWKPILDCDLCSTTVSNFDEMKDHFRVAHNTRSYIKCCERKFYRRYVLIDHIRLHVNPETHKCDICGKRSTTKYNLKLHKQVVHSESKQFECEVCNRLFNQKPTLDRHLLTHIKGDKKFFCKECDKGYFVEDQLKYHIKTVHNVDRVCDQCGKTIHGVAALKKHLMEHAGIAKRKFPCDICGVELVTNYGLRRHKAAYHHDGSTAYVCGVCGKVASSHNALMSHKKNVHENGRCYKCIYCDKAFKRAKVLREHIATHTGVDLYQCPHCPQTFKVSANMHHHRKRAHPIEWEEGRKNRTELPKVDIQQVTNQVIL